MKKISLVFLCIFLSNLARADEYTAIRRSNGLLRFIAKHETLRDFALFSVMAVRCTRYVLNGEASNCEDAVDEQIALLDYDLLVSSSGNAILENLRDPESYVFIAFKKNTIDLLNKKETGTYLHLIQDRLTRFQTGADPTATNLWETSVHFFGSESLAIKVMAALFQDTSINKLHLAYLERSGTRGSMYFEENKELLTQVINTINIIMDSSEAHYRTMFYPPKLQGLINRNIYHFYVPMYLGSALRERGVSAMNAAAAPVMLTLAYEFITSSRDLSYVYSDPTVVTDPQSLLDIFSGYAGARMGANLEFSMRESVEGAFKHSTASGVTLLLK
jgi:hypothetical protein